MSRYPPIPENKLNEAQQAVHRKTADLFSLFPSHLVWKTDNGQIMGPYSSLFYTDDLSGPWFQLASAVMRQQRFTTKEKELCILAVLSEYEVPYVHYAHSEIAVCAGFSKDQVQQALHGNVPVKLAEREAAVYELARTLARQRKPLDRATFDAAVEVLGREGVAGVAHVVCGYIYVAMLTNISDGVVPEPKEGVFLASKNPKLARL